MDVEASRAIRQAEVGAAQTMIERTEACFGIRPKWLAADSAYGSASNLDWLVNEQGIAPHAHHSDGITDQKSLQRTSATKSTQSGHLDCAEGCPLSGGKADITI